MEANTKKIVIYSALAIVGIGLSVYTFKKIKNTIQRNRGDRDKPGTPDEQPYNPQTQFKLVKLGQQGYVNVRSTPLVPETMNYLDWLVTPWEYLQDKTKSNLIGKVTTNPVGFVSKEEKGADGYLWYRIQLYKPIGETKYAWVREDAVTIEIKNK